MFLRGLAPLPWPSCSLMWMFYEHLQMLMYLSCINSFILLQIWPQLIGLSTGSTQEGQSQHDWKMINWDIKNENKTFNCFILLQIWPQLIWLSTGSTQEGQSQHDWKIVNWDIKNENKTFVSFYCRYDLSLSGLVLVQPRKASPNMTWKIVNWDIKNENKIFNCFILLQIWPQLIGLSTGKPRKASPNTTEK